MKPVDRRKAMSLKGKLAIIWMRKKDRIAFNDELEAMGPGIAPEELKK